MKYEYDVVYSPDEMSWYIQRFPGGQTTIKTFSEKWIAKRALADHVNNIKRLNFGKY